MIAGQKRLKRHRARESWNRRVCPWMNALKGCRGTKASACQFLPLILTCGTQSPWSIEVLECVFLSPDIICLFYKWDKCKGVIFQTHS